MDAPMRENILRRCKASHGVAIELHLLNAKTSEENIQNYIKTRVIEINDAATYGTYNLVPCTHSENAICCTQYSCLRGRTKKTESYKHVGCSAYISFQVGNSNWIEINWIINKPPYIYIGCREPSSREARFNRSICSVVTGVNNTNPHSIHMHCSDIFLQNETIYSKLVYYAPGRTLPL